MSEALAEIQSRIALTEMDQREHARCTRMIDALACEIRLQALREAEAIISGRPLPPNMLFVRKGVRSRRRP